MPETVAERFWAESHRKAERDKEIAAMPRRLERFEAILKDAWTSDNLAAVSRGESMHFGPAHRI